MGDESTISPSYPNTGPPDIADDQNITSSVQASQPETRVEAPTGGTDEETETVVGYPNESQDNRETDDPESANLEATPDCFRNKNIEWAFIFCMLGSLCVAVRFHSNHSCPW